MAPVSPGLGPTRSGRRREARAARRRDTGARSRELQTLLRGVHGLRVGLWLLAAALSVALPDSGWALVWLAALAPLSLAATFLGPRTARVLLVAEAAALAVGVLRTGGADSPLLAYLPASAAAAGLIGARSVVLVVGAAAAVLVFGRYAVMVDGREFTARGAEWVIIALLVGLAATRAAAAGRRPADDGYGEAYRLLRLLRSVSEGLPGSLDPGSVAATLLDDCNAVHAAPRGVVLVRRGEQLVPLSMRGWRRLPWRAGLDMPSPLRTAWDTRRNVVDQRPPDADGRRQGGTLLVVPALRGDERLGLVALECTGEGWTPAQVRQVEEVVRRAALPLETAGLFDDLRTSAANEERHQLAREMHDGIAQDLAHLGYEVDSVAAGLRARGDAEGAEQVRAIRGRLTGMMSDLRLSISDLKSSLSPARGLGAALTEFTRNVGTTGKLTVHLSLTEGVNRLPTEVEVQLLRIAHDTIGRARRRPGVQNLWVTLVADPPDALLRIADDAPASARDDSSWTASRDRAARIGGTLTVTPRDSGGTTVEVRVLGGGDGR